VRKVKKLKYNGGIGIASAGFYDDDLMKSSNAMMNKDVSDMMVENKRMTTKQ
jgi:hypothetical protein